MHKERRRRRVAAPVEEERRRARAVAAPNPEGRAVIGRRAASLVVDSRTRLISSSLLARQPITTRRARADYSDRTYPRRG